MPAKLPTLLDSGRYSEALHGAEAACAGKKPAPDSLLLLARAQSALQLHASAEKTFGRACASGARGAWFWRGRNSMKRGRLWQAIECFAKALAEGVDDIDKLRARAALAHAQAAAGWPVSPRKNMDAALRGAPTDLSIHADAAGIALLRRDWAACENHLQNSAGLDALLVQANMHFVRGAYADAERSLNAALKAAPESVDAQLLFGELFMLLSQWERAASAFTVAADISPQGASADYALMQAGICQYEAGREDSAKKSFERCRATFAKGAIRKEAGYYLKRLQTPGPRGTKVFIEDFPFEIQLPDYCGPAALANMLSFWKLPIQQKDIGEALNDDGVAHWKLSQFARDAGLTAISFVGEEAALRGLLDLHVPVLCDEYEGLDGHYLVLLGYDDRLGVWIVQDPNFREPVRVRYPEFRERRKLGGQWACVIVPAEQSAFVRDMNLPGAELMLLYESACGEFDLGHFSAAGQSAREVLQIDKHFLPAYKLIIQTEMLRQNWNGASQRLRNWLERHPRSHWGLKYLGDCYHELGNPYLAGKFYRQALEVHEDDYSAAVLLGKSLLELEDREEAAQWLSRAADIDAGQGWAFLYLGEAAEAEGRTEAARRYYGIALELDSRYTFLSEKLAPRDGSPPS